MNFTNFSFIVLCCSIISYKESRYESVSKEIYANIKIDKEYLETQPLIRIAKTMVHEVVHTHLALVKINSPYATKVGDYSHEEFASLLDAHFELKVDEHEFIAEYYIPTMSKALEEILFLLESQERIDYIGTLFHFQGDENLGLWDWNDFFEYISWSGLESTHFFDNLTNEGSISIGLYNSYNNYSRVGKETSNQFSTQP